MGRRSRPQEGSVDPGRIPADARVLGLGLGRVNIGEAGTAVVTAVDEGKLTISEAQKLMSVLRDLIPVREVEAFRAQIVEAKAAALEAARAGRALVPAGRQTVEVSEPPVA